MSDDRGRRDKRGSDRGRGDARGREDARRTPARAGKPPRAERRPAPYDVSVHLDDDIVRELRATARPGKAEILIKVFADAATAFAAGDVEEAIKLGEQSKHIALRAPSIREVLGLAYYHAGRWQEAARELSAFRRITGTTDQNPVIADAYRAMEKPLRAVELIDEMPAEDVAQAVYYEGQIVAAGALGDLGRVDEAVARLEALELKPTVVQEHHLRVWYVLADLLERKGRFTQARDWFQAVAATDSELTDAPERLARLSGA